MPLEECRRCILNIRIRFDIRIFLEELEWCLQFSIGTKFTYIITHYTEFASGVVGEEFTLSFVKFCSNEGREFIVGSNTWSLYKRRREGTQAGIPFLCVISFAILHLVTTFFKVDESCQSEFNPVLESFPQRQSKCIFHLPVIGKVIEVLIVIKWHTLIIESVDTCAVGCRKLSVHVFILKGMNDTWDRNEYLLGITFFVRFIEFADKTEIITMSQE